MVSKWIQIPSPLSIQHQLGHPHMEESVLEECSTPPQFHVIITGDSISVCGGVCTVLSAIDCFMEVLSKFSQI